MTKMVLVLTVLLMGGCNRDHSAFHVTKTFHRGVTGSDSAQFVVTGYTERLSYQLTCNEGPGENPCFYVQAGATYHIKEQEHRGDVMDLWVSFREMQGTMQVFTIETTEAR